MSQPADLSSSVSSISSISLLEIKAETHLVLHAFLHRTLSVPLTERPGRVGGAYRDHNKYRSKSQPRAKDGWDSQVEDASSADEKKGGFRDLIKQLPLRNTARRSAKDDKGSFDKDGKGKVPSLRDQAKDTLNEQQKNLFPQDDVIPPSSTSEDDDTEKKQQRKLKQKKIRRKISRFFRLKLEKEKDSKVPGSPPQAPRTLPTDKEPEPAPPSAHPNHPLDFYNEVAEKLEKIAHNSTSIRNVTPTVQPAPAASEKEAVVRQLVQVLSLEGDSINTKIQSDPFLRTSLSRLSYASFAKLLDTFSSSEVSEASPLPSAASPTLRRMAISMEVSRRIVTATGAQRMQGYAECYMETFVPWVKSHGGWENVVCLEEHSEYD